MTAFDDDKVGFDDAAKSGVADHGDDDDADDAESERLASATALSSATTTTARAAIASVRVITASPVFLNSKRRGSSSGERGIEWKKPISMMLVGLSRSIVQKKKKGKTESGCKDT